MDLKVGCGSNLHSRGGLLLAPGLTYIVGKTRLCGWGYVSGECVSRMFVSCLYVAGEEKRKSNPF